MGVTECGVDSDYRDNGDGHVVRGFTVGETVQGTFQTMPPSGKRVPNWPVGTSLEFSSL